MSHLRAKRSKLIECCRNVSRETMWIFKVFLSFFVLIFLVPGCGEDSIAEDYSVFNKAIEEKEDIVDAGQLMKLYHEYRFGSDSTGIDIQHENLYSRRYRAVLIINKNHDGDSEKFVMIAKLEGKKWKVLSVERNWRCISKNSESDWGIERCE